MVWFIDLPSSGGGRCRQSRCATVQGAHGRCRGGAQDQRDHLGAPGAPVLRAGMRLWEGCQANLSCIPSHFPFMCTTVVDQLKDLVTRFQGLVISWLMALTQIRLSCYYFMHCILSTMAPCQHAVHFHHQHGVEEGFPSQNEALHPRF